MLRLRPKYYTNILELYGIFSLCLYVSKSMYSFNTSVDIRYFVSFDDVKVFKYTIPMFSQCHADPPKHTDNGDNAAATILKRTGNGKIWRFDRVNAVPSQY